MNKLFVIYKMGAATGLTFLSPKGSRWLSVPNKHGIGIFTEEESEKLLYSIHGRNGLRNGVLTDIQRLQVSPSEKRELKFTIAFPVPVKNQTPDEAWENSKLWSSKEITTTDPVVFIEPCTVAGVFANKVYFLKDGATYWHYVTGIFKLTDAKYH